MRSAVEPITTVGYTLQPVCFLALFVLALSAGGCGSDSPNPAAPTLATPAPTPPPPAPPPAPEPVPTCQVGMVLRPGESCTYPGTSDTLTVNSDGTASFLFITSGSSINITSGNISLQATRQSDGSWRIERVGNDATAVGDAIELVGELECSVERHLGDLVRGTISARLRATRSITTILVIGKFIERDGAQRTHLLPPEILGGMFPGQVQSYSSWDFFTSTANRFGCEIDVEWPTLGQSATVSVRIAAPHSTVVSLRN